MNELESRFWRLSWGLLLLVWVAMVAWPSVGIGYLLDDFVGLDALSRGQGDFLRGAWWPGGGEIYRPLGFVFFWVEWLVFGGRVWAIHGLHLVLFGFAAWLSARLVGRATGRSSRDLEISVTVLALLWPGRLEVAVWIAALFDLLVLILVQLGLISWLRRDSGRRGGLALMSIALAAALAKETGFVLSVIVIVLAFFDLARDGWWPTVRRLALVLVPQAGVFVLRFVALGGGLGGYAGQDAGNLAHGLSAMPELIFRAVLAPLHPQRPSFQVLALSTLVVAVLALLAIGVSGLIRSRRFVALYGALLLGPLLMVAPYLKEHQIVFDSRYLSLSGCAIVAVFGCLALEPGRRRWLLPLLAFLWLCSARVNIEPWLEAAELREMIVSTVAEEVAAGEGAMIRIAGPIGRVGGAQALGSHVELLLQRRLPDRHLRAESLEHLEARGLQPSSANGLPEVRLRVWMENGRLRIERLPGLVL